MPGKYVARVFDYSPPAAGAALGIGIFFLILIGISAFNSGVSLLALLTTASASTVFLGPLSLALLGVGLLAIGIYATCKFIATRERNKVFKSIKPMINDIDNVLKKLQNIEINNSKTLPIDATTIRSLENAAMLLKGQADGSISNNIDQLNNIKKLIESTQQAIARNEKPITPLNIASDKLHDESEPAPKSEPSYSVVVEIRNAKGKGKTKSHYQDNESIHPYSNQRARFYQQSNSLDESQQLIPAKDTPAMRNHSNRQ